MKTKRLKVISTRIDGNKTSFHKYYLGKTEINPATLPNDSPYEFYFYSGLLIAMAEHNSERLKWRQAGNTVTLKAKFKEY